MIYLDHAAATPLRREVATAMAEIAHAPYGNPSSSHGWGRAARAALEDARERAAQALATAPRRVHFVRGGTESINLAILGRVDWALASGRARPWLLRSTLEHSAVRAAMAAAEARGCIVQTIDVSPTADIVLPAGGAGALQGAALVSVQWVNQETGLRLPVEALAESCAEAGVPLHVDAIQAGGKLHIDMSAHPISALSLSGHKLGGPASTGLLVLAEGVELHPRVFGGGQERGLRPGTEDVAGAVGFAVALDISVRQLERETVRLAALRERLETGLLGRLPRLRVHGAEGPRAPHILNVGVPDTSPDLLHAALDGAGIAASPGTACRSGAVTASPVLRALYGEEATRNAPLRLSLGWPSKPGEVDRAVKTVSAVVEGFSAR
ncbi:MAG: cysteine desulfurase family protein [Gammaproteobacteria bacterium]|nr:cysteine desulfurase family protein [Gammaproteobacteria bacterium]